METYQPTHIFIAADHGGYAAKQALVKSLGEETPLTDLGADSLDPNDDYPDFATHLGQKVASTPGAVGILLCRSGEGMAMAANKIAGIRAALAWNEAVARESRGDNDANVLTLPTDYLESEQLVAIAKAWLATPFSGEERHKRRIQAITQLEQVIL